MKKMRIACVALALAVGLGCGGQAWGAEPTEPAAQAGATMAVDMEQRILTDRIQIRQVVNQADEHYLLASVPNGQTLRLDFAVEGEEAALLVDAQTGITADWAAVQAGDWVMLNYSQRPQGNILHYLLLNLPEDLPNGLFTVEDMAGLLESRILVDNGRLWVRLPKGVWLYPEEYYALSLGVGHQVLLWYEVEDDSQQPAQALASKMLHLYSPQEILQQKQDKQRADMYYNDLQTRHLLVNDVELPDVVRYVHGEPYLPLRQTAENCGFTVEWLAEDEAAILHKGDWQARVVPYKGVFWLAGGDEQAYYGLPRIYDDTICVPAELFEIFGADISVSGQTMIINLTN